jgi:hypothetical protein
MREKISDLIVDKAVDIWCKKLFVPVFDNGDNSAHGGMSHMIATMNIQNDKAGIDDISARVEKFRGIITAELMRLRDSPADKEYFPSWLDVDYGPCAVLGDAANKAGIPQSQFSCKSSVSMRANSLSAKFGYGAPGTNYYPLPDGRWLLTSITADDAEMGKIIDSVMGGNPLGLAVEV